MNRGFQVFSVLILAALVTAGCSNSDSKNNSAATPASPGNEYPNGGGGNGGPVGPDGRPPGNYGECPMLSGTYVLQNGTDISTVQSRPLNERRGRGRNSIIVYYMNGSSIAIVPDGTQRRGGQGKMYVARCRRSPFPTLEMTVSSPQNGEMYLQYSSPSGNGSVMVRRMQMQGGQVNETTWLRRN